MSVRAREMQSFYLLDTRIVDFLAFAATNLCSSLAVVEFIGGAYAGGRACTCTESEVVSSSSGSGEVHKDQNSSVLSFL